MTKKNGLAHLLHFMNYKCQICYKFYIRHIHLDLTSNKNRQHVARKDHLREVMTSAKVKSY